MPIMDAVIISIGTELVTGQTVDSNSAWLASRLTPLGVQVVEHLTVGDDRERVTAAIRRGLEQADLVIATGGLGPTPDDLTREAISEAISAPLVLDEGALAQIQDLFARWQRSMPESNRSQAMIPQGCAALPNPRGSAPGIMYHEGTKRLFALPGVPNEMKAMFEASLGPELRGLGVETRTRSARLQCFGISEAKLGEVLGDLMARGRNPQVGTTASGAILSVRILARGRDADEAQRLADADSVEVRRRLERVVFADGEESLQAVVAGRLLEENRTVATAESCTGGLLAKRFTDIPGSSAYFLRGYVTYSNQAKIELLSVPEELIEAEGAVSGPVVRAMASGCLEASGADFALAITGIAGPTGGSPPERPVGLVYIGLADADGVEVKRYLIGDHWSREEIRDRSCKCALNLLRLRLLQPNAG